MHCQGDLTVALGQHFQLNDLMACSFQHLGLTFSNIPRFYTELVFTVPIVTTQHAAVADMTTVAMHLLQFYIVAWINLLETAVTMRLTHIVFIQ